MKKYAQVNMEYIRIVTYYYSLLFFITTSPLLSCSGQTNNDDFPLILQENSYECGPVCLKMIGDYYGLRFELDTLISLSGTDSTGVSLLGLSIAADSMGLKNLGVQISFEALIKEAPLPAIVHWNTNHFVIVYKANHKKVWVADPASGKVEYSKEEFCNHWLQSKHERMETGIALLFEMKKE